MKVSIALAIPLSLWGLTTTVATPVLTQTELRLVQNLTPQEVNLRAKQFTVRIDGAGVGTGVIIDEADNAYTVLTNWHVVKQPGEYFIQTIDGRKHPVNYQTVQQLPDLDLAILQFERAQNYQVAETGNSNRLIEGQNIYFAGYPGELRKEDNRYYRFFSANLVSILPQSTANGYSLVYNGEAFPGMSGGPVLDSEGFLIGIHGETNIHALTGGTSNYAIPINSYQASIAQIDSSPTPNNNQSSQATEKTAVNTPSANSPNPSFTEDNTTPEQPVATENAQDNPPVARDSSANTESSAIPQNNTPVKVGSSVNTEPAANTEPENSIEKNTAPLNSPSPSNTEKKSGLPPIVSVPTLSNPSSNPAQPSGSSPKPELLSAITGINYSPLKELLTKQQWKQADIKTQELINRIIETAKRQNRNSFITINAIADFACQDIRTIDSLWQQYSNNQFGFTPQQKVWRNNKQNNDFSPDSWRRFATKIGWKQGDVSNSGGYLLYEQLTFDPQNAPQGHLPWWFAASEEKQNIIKSIFNRCSFNPTAPKLS